MLHGPLADHQCVCDVAVRESSGDELENLTLAARKRVEVRVLRLPPLQAAKDVAGNSWRDVALSCDDRAQRLQERLRAYCVTASGSSDTVSITMRESGSSSRNSGKTDSPSRPGM
jgi:hypothetical protein